MYYANREWADGEESGGQEVRDGANEPATKQGPETWYRTLGRPTPQVSRNSF